MRTVFRILLAISVLLVLIQFVPYGRNHTNPPVVAEPQWDSSKTRGLVKSACFDCHSNETEWPWYSHVAPVSWLIQRDVEKGRSKLNFSEWNRPEQEADEAAEKVRNGEMPLWFYLPLHPEARMSAAEKDTFIRKLQENFGDKEMNEMKKEETY